MLYIFFSTYAIYEILLARLLSRYQVGQQRVASNILSYRGRSDNYEWDCLGTV